jgi:PleD family two-component response regulator
VAYLDDTDLDVGAVLARADQRMYAAKHSGRNRVVGDEAGRRS